MKTVGDEQLKSANTEVIVAVFKRYNLKRKIDKEIKETYERLLQSELSSVDKLQESITSLREQIAEAGSEEELTHLKNNLRSLERIQRSTERRIRSLKDEIKEF